MQRLLASVWDDGAFAVQDFREFGFFRIDWEVKLRHVEGHQIDERVHHLDWGHVIFLSAWAKRLWRVRRLKKLGRSPMLGGLASMALTMS